MRRLTAGRHDSSPQWSPDGKFLAFVRTPEKEGKPQPPQIFILPLDGGEAWQLTHLPKGASAGSGPPMAPFWLSRVPPMTKI
jgi:Tol biopolymer transport system component